MFLCLLFKHFHGQKNMEVHYINRTLEIRQKKMREVDTIPQQKGIKKLNLLSSCCTGRTYNALVRVNYFAKVQLHV